VSDPDRDQVHLVDTAAAALLGTLQLEAGSQPARLAFDGADRGWVVLRAAGSIVEFSLGTMAEVQRHESCAEPWGVAYDSVRDALVVACRGGQLVRISATGLPELYQLPHTDLRDVVVEGDRYLVSRFKTAQVMILDAESAKFHDVLAPRGVNNNILGNLAPSTLFKLQQLPDGRVVMQHQRANRGQLVAVYYGPATCTPGVVQSMVSVVDAPDPAQETDPSVVTARGDGGADPVPAVYVPQTRNVLRYTAPDRERITDFAVDDSASQYAAITDTGPTSLVRWQPFNSMDDGDCPQAAAAASDLTVAGQAAAVSFISDGALAIQLREPATIQVWRNSTLDSSIVLSDSSVEDLGHYVFHARSASGLACSSCHPEGGDDGNIWDFQIIGKRRTQPLWGGLLGMAPYHWGGEHATLDDVLNDTLRTRMRGLENFTVPETVAQRLGGWLDSLPSPPAPILAAESLLRGRTAFEKAECMTCHAGGLFTDNQIHDVGTGGSFKTPSLVGLRTKAPLMHNGCAPTIADRFTPCGGVSHGNVAALDEVELADLIVYLQSL
jgi:hypothetical protein